MNLVCSHTCLDKLKKLKQRCCEAKEFLEATLFVNSAFSDVTVFSNANNARNLTKQKKMMSCKLCGTDLGLTYLLRTEVHVCGGCSL
jgi:hypothetical protein